MKTVIPLVLVMSIGACTKTVTNTVTNTLVRDSLIVQIDSVSKPETYIIKDTQYDAVSGARIKFTFTTDSNRVKWTARVQLDSIVYDSTFIYWAPRYHYLLFIVDSSPQDVAEYIYGNYDMYRNLSVYDSTYVLPYAINPYSARLTRSNYPDLLSIGN